MPRKLGLSSQILLGLIAGIACGLFFGDFCSWLSIVGDAFVGLLRMTVLPYIVVSLIANLGRLSFQHSRRLASVGGAVLLGLWSTVLCTICVAQRRLSRMESRLVLQHGADRTAAGS